ncbi:MAG: Fic family protein [Nanoarchaeota archaeon]
MGKFIGKPILREIEDKQEELARQMNNPLGFIIGGFHMRSLEQEAVLHSFKIEYPDKFKHGSTQYDTHASGRKKKEGIKALERAFTYGSSHFKRDKPETFNDSLIQGIAGRIGHDTFNSNEAPYRKKSVSIAGASWKPPYPDKIPDQLASFFYDICEILKDDSIGATVEAAAFAHLNLDRIHPFIDCNGRTCRTVQNVILRSKNLPPPVIYSGERFDYYRRLQKAIEGWQGRIDKKQYDSISEGEEQYYNYIGSLVSSSLDRLLD